jgi:hypothetical protein
MNAKIRTVCIDTLTAIQNEEYMTSSRKPGHDQWADFGKGVWELISAIQDRGFTIILVLGEPGTGKSSGMRTLPKDTNIWINADNKNPVWVGGKEEYGKKFAPRKPYHIVPKTYADVINHIDLGLSKNMFEEERFCILTGHTEDYKSGNEYKKRLKLLGKVATKFQLEGRLETVLYSQVVKEGGEIKYLLETQNDGYNTARSPMGAFEPLIENDYNHIVETLINY